MNTIIALLAVLSIWEYPARQPQHERLRAQLIVAMREGDTQTMAETCRKGADLFPDDPTWAYNRACSLAYFENRQPALDALEKAIDLGFRDAKKISEDSDLQRLKDMPRFKELVDYAKEMATKPVRMGPLAAVNATGVFGEQVILGEQNLAWDFENGCYLARLKMVAASAEGSAGDLYMNRDNRHSYLNVADFPGLTEVTFGEKDRARPANLNLPNMIFPYPVFGNCSRAYTSGPYWRSFPRDLVTRGANRLPAIEKLYRSNQTWVMPANADIAPVGTNGDLFASITPYIITTAGRSYSDLPYLRAALTCSRSFTPDVKRRLVVNGLLAPMIQTLIRKSLRGVTNETAYLTAQAHPTAFPPGAVDLQRLTDAAAALTPAAIPPLVSIQIGIAPPKNEKLVWPEATYATHYAAAVVLRAEQKVREFLIRAEGAKEIAFVQTHGAGIDVKIEKLAEGAAKVTIDRTGMTPINRVDITVVGRNPGTGWGPPSYVSFARMDPDAPYSDPCLTTLKEPKAEKRTR